VPSPEEVAATTSAPTPAPVPTQEEPETAAQPETTPAQPQTYGQPETPAQPQSAYGQPEAPTQPGTPVQPQPTAQYGDLYRAPEEQKKNKKGAVAIIVTFVVLLLVLAAAVAAIFLFKGRSSGDSSYSLSYVKNGKVYYVKDIRKDDDGVVVTSIRNADDYDNGNLSGTFTEDGKYLYFYNKMEDSTTGKLCRVEVSKLKADEDKNEDLIEELVSGVTSYTLLDDDRFFYLNNSNELYYYDGEDKNRIASDVSYYYLSGEDKVAFYTTTNQIGTYSIADDSTETVIDNCSYILSSTETGYFYVVYDEETGSYGLYYCTSEGDSQKVAENTYTIVGAVADSITAYYVEERTENVCYYDLVNDIYAEADANITQPAVKDYLVPCTEYDAMSDWDRSYFASYPEEIESFYSWLYEDYYYDTGMLYYYSYHTDESGNGSYNYYFYDESTTQWYLFNEEAYNEAVEAYDAVSDRISLREALQETTADITYYDLYAWTPDDGQTVVASNVAPYTTSLLGQTGIVVYQKYGEIGKTDWPEETYGTWFVEDYIYDCRYGEDAQTSYYYNYNGSEAEWNNEWADLGDSSSSVYFDASPSGKYVMAFVYSWDDDYNSVMTMSALSLEDGTLSLLDSNIAAASSGIWMDDDYYYFETESGTEGNLCCYSNGKESTVLKNISNMQVRRYENGTCSAYADYDSTNGGTLKLFNEDGDSTKIDSDVSDYCYISDNLIVYLRDGKLYVYRGENKDKFKIDSSVTSYTCDQAAYETLLY
jgi:hypothetical protein